MKSPTVASEGAKQGTATTKDTNNVAQPSSISNAQTPRDYPSYYEICLSSSVAIEAFTKGYNPLPCGKPMLKEEAQRLPVAKQKLLKAPYGVGELEPLVYNVKPTIESVKTLFVKGSYLVGIAANGLLIIDLDSKHDGFIEALEACQMALPHYGTQSTISNGRHFVARLPHGITAKNGGVFWKGKHVGETRSGNAYACLYQPEKLIPVDDLPEFDPSELPEGLTLTNTGMGETVGSANPSRSSAMVDGALLAIEDMVLAKAPECRHESLAAVLNIGYRLGVLDGTVEILASDAVLNLWCSDGTRDAQEWQNEIDRWVESVKTKHGQGYGVPYLEKQGLKVWEVKRLLLTVPVAAKQDTPIEEWGERQPLAPRPAVETLPAEMLPEAIRTWLVDAARLACLPLEMMAVNAICALSSVIGAAVTIQARAGFHVVPNLWGCGVASSGGMKSHALKTATAPLRQLEQEAARNAELENEDTELEISQAEKQLEKLEKAFNEKKPMNKHGIVPTRDDIKAGRRDVESLKRGTTKPRRYVTSDTTYEAFGMRLADNQKGMLLERDELAPFISDLSREENAKTRGFFNAAWNGDSHYTFDRVTRGDLYLHRVCVSICGMMQPKLLDSIISKMLADPMQNDGFLQRFQMLVYPDAYPEWIPPEQQAPPNKEAFEDVVKLHKLLDNLEQYNDEGNLEPRLLKFSNQAQTEFNQWHDDLERRTRPNGEMVGDTAYKSWYTKTKSLCVSLAAIFHLCNEAQRGEAWGDYLEPISLDALRMALDWCDYLETHAKKVYALELQPEQQAALALAQMIEDGKITAGATVRDVKQVNRSQSETIETGLVILERLGWLRVEESRDGKTIIDGKPKRVIRLHPDLAKGAAMVSLRRVGGF